MPERFSRSELLFGHEAMAKLANCRVAVFGVGGVGSYAVEALARGGVGHIDVFDGDIVSASNINRQLIALESTVGKNKTDVAKERILDINPSARVETHVMFVLPENISEIDFSKYDCVIDAIDTVSGKIAIIEAAKAAGAEVLSCMGTGNKLNPTMFRVADISETSVCPLARVMRLELRKRGISGVKVIYSEEPPQGSSCPRNAESGKTVPASCSFVPGVAGLILAGEAIKTLISVKQTK
jgi:tRNA A37 threonylcarbamoyladenosine dehydratase